MKSNNIMPDVILTGKVVEDDDQYITIEKNNGDTVVCFFTTFNRDKFSVNDTITIEGVLNRTSLTGNLLTITKIVKIDKVKKYGE